MYHSAVNKCEGERVGVELGHDAVAWLVADDTADAVAPYDKIVSEKFKEIFLATSFIG
jgi:hypothetical protein